MVNVFKAVLQITGVCICTNKDEGQSDPKGQDVASQRLVVLSVAFGENSNTRVDIVLTQGLQERRVLLLTGVYIVRRVRAQVASYLENFGSTD